MAQKHSNVMFVEEEDTQKYAALAGELKKLAVQLSMVEKCLSTVRKTHSQRPYYIGEKERILSEMDKVKAEMRTMMTTETARINATEVTVSDHALMRWLERKHDLDIETLRKKVVPEVVQTFIKRQQIVDNWGVTHEGMLYIIRGWLIVTIVKIDKPLNETMKVLHLSANGEEIK